VLTFGTDGVRGRYGTELTDGDAHRLGRCAAAFLGAKHVVLGVDTRASGPALAAALASGLSEAGCSVDYVGVAPTPAIATLARLSDVAAAVVTASHNPWYDNGIKLFARGGVKLDDEQQESVERASQTAARSTDDAARAGSHDGASLTPSRTVLLRSYEDEVINAVARQALAGMTIVVDCANGAMSDVAPRVLGRAGARCVIINASPDGRNINDDCGATAPGRLTAAVIAAGAELGVAFDGDGDRLIAADHNGRVVDGDRLIALAAIDCAQRGVLRGSGVVVTTMTNLGFHEAMQRAGIDVVVTPVGDRSVSAALDAHDFVLGGEQSGHIIHRLHSTSGDGLLSALLLADLVKRRKQPLAELATAVMESYPQVLRNVRVAEKPANIDDVIGIDIATERAALGERGRIVVRVSGTEPVVRVMVEAPDASTANACAQRIVELVERTFSVV
jgi:phosphoglucosamine mutase